jgi:hypothetical protein
MFDRQPVAYTLRAVPPNPAELLERNAFKKLLERAKQDFDYIIIDNAPVSYVTDGIITGRESDLNIFILRYGVSRKDQLKFINDTTTQGIMNHPQLLSTILSSTAWAMGITIRTNIRTAKAITKTTKPNRPAGKIRRNSWSEKIDKKLVEIPGYKPSGFKTV